MLIEILPICRVLEILCIDVFGVYDMYSWRCMLCIRCVVVWIFMHVIFVEKFWWRDFYFLNKCFLRVYYRFNRNRALQVGITTMVSLVRTSIQWISCWYANGTELPSILVVLFCCSYLLVGWFCYRSEMASWAGRNDDAIAEALTAVAQAVAQAQGNGGHDPQDQGEAEERRLDHFMRKNPPTFKGRFNPKGALTWTEGMERIFRAMVTNND